MPRHLRAEYPDSYGDQIKDTVRARINGREVVVELPNARTLSRNLHTMEQAWVDNLPILAGGKAFFVLIQEGLASGIFEVN